mgnify:CR=1 FL=1
MKIQILIRTIVIQMQALARLVTVAYKWVGNNKRDLGRFSYGFVAGVMSAIIREHGLPLDYAYLIWAAR